MCGGDEDIAEPGAFDDFMRDMDVGFVGFRDPDRDDCIVQQLLQQLYYFFESLHIPTHRAQGTAKLSVSSQRPRRHKTGRQALQTSSIAAHRIPNGNLTYNV